MLEAPKIPTRPRCIRFAPPELLADNQQLPPELRANDPKLKQWRTEHVPQQWQAPKDHVLYVRRGAADLNGRYGNMLNALAKSRCPDAAVHDLALELIHQGEDARAWIAAGETNDPNARRRSSDSSFLDNAEETPALARRLASRVEQDQSTLALAAALHSTRIRIVAPEEAQATAGTALAKLLREYARVLPRYHTARRGPFWHRAVVGPFVYPKPVDGRTAPREATWRTSTAVMFGAVLAARQATSGILGQVGNLMPEKTGEPLYAVAADLVKAVTGEDVAAGEVRIRLKDWIKRNPRVGWVGWPDRGA